MKKLKLLISLFLLPISFSCTSCDFFYLTTEEPQTQSVSKSLQVPTSMKVNLSSSVAKQINPVLTGFNDSNPTFSFKSSNESVVTVSSDGVLTGHKEGTATVTVTYTKNTKYSASINVEVYKEEMLDYTIMLYMCGSDLEYDSTARGSDADTSLFTEDIQEILSVKDIPSSVKIIIETGGTTKWHMPRSYLDGASEISSSSLQRWEVENGKLKHIATLNTNYMASQGAFQDFLTWGLTNYSAEQMGVIISGHGGGIAGCAYDDNYLYPYGDYFYQHTLQTFEVAEACKNALGKSDRNKFTWIGYDCCVMQDADIASINADYFDYMVASQESENGNGWNHDVYLPYLTANPKISPEEFLPTICDAFLEDNHTSNEREKCLQTLSVLDLSKMDKVIAEFNEYSSKIGITSIAYSKVKNAFKASYNAFGEKVYGLCDFNSFMSKLSTYFTSYDNSSVVNAINDLVIYNAYCSKYTTTPCGVNAFFPESLDKDYSLQVGKEDYSNSLSTKFTNWQTLCVNNGNFGWDSIY